MKYEKVKIEYEDPELIRELSRQILDLMYPKDPEEIGVTFKQAREMVIARNKKKIINPQNIRSEIGTYFKYNADMNRWERQAVSVPLGKKLEPAKKSKEPYEDPFAKAKRLHRERELKANPLFADQVNEEIDNEELRRGF